MRYKAGDKVVIVSEAVCGMNNKGLMDKWLGKTMTIQQAEKYLLFPYRMIEDNQEWEWRDSMIDHEATAKLTLTQHTEKSGSELKKESIEKHISECYDKIKNLYVCIENLKLEIKGL